MTLSPASAVPHTGTAISRCSTMWSEKTTAGVTFADAILPNNSAITAQLSHFFMILFLFIYLDKNGKNKMTVW